jgi:hypothetical protein
MMSDDEAGVNALYSCEGRKDTHMQIIARQARRLRIQAALSLAALAVIGTLAVLSAPGSGLGRRLGLGAAPRGTGPQPTATLIQTNVTFDYVTGYASLRQLKADADLVLLGTVTGIKGATYLQGFKYVTTTFTFRIEAVLGGKQQAQFAASQVMPVQQAGGIAEGVQTTNRDDPLMAVGERAFVFLHYRQDGVLGSPAYETLGGPQGRFTVSSGIVHSLHASPMIPDVGMSEADFQAAIARA